MVWGKLAEIARALANHQRVVVPSGHGLGKSWLSARLALWFLTCFKPSKVVTTARSWEQVRTILWSEIAAAYNESKLNFGGRLLETELKVDDGWFALGLSPKKDAAESGFGIQRLQGLHSPNMLIIIDEAGLVDADVLIAANKLVVSDNNKILMIGNPASPSGPFYEACNSPRWRKVHLSCFDHPNVVEERIVVPGAVTKEWIEVQREDLGEDAPLWKTSVLGEFPDETTATLFPLASLENAKQPGESDDQFVIGLDVAGPGRDLTVAVVRQGSVIRAVKAFGSADPRGEVMAFINEYKANLRVVNVDSVGIGYNFGLHLRDNRIPVNLVNVGERSSNSERFQNLKAEAFWGLRRRFQEGDVKNLNDPKLLQELSGLTWETNSRGQIAIISKSKLAKSPDYADALMLAFVYGDAKESFGIKTSSQLLAGTFGRAVRPATAGLRTRVL